MLRQKNTNQFFFTLLLISSIILSFFIIQIPPLHNQKKNSPPKFAPSQKYLIKPPVSQFSHGSRDLPLIALTFDADMNPAMYQDFKEGKIKSFYNHKIVEILESKRIPATIFMTGMWAQTYPQIASFLAKNPLFEIGNHSYSHPRFTPSCSALPDLPPWGKEGEFEKSQTTIENITGVKPIYFRFPGGCSSVGDIKLANKYGLTVINWDVASGDSYNDNPRAIVNTVKTKTQNGSIILFHFDGGENSPSTSDVLPELIDYLQNKGFIFVNLTDLLFSLEKVE